ncbi:MAG: M56 family metallopeptidase [Candidatus Kerfeldbacteria bacterium]|nr:M56 family metallopeptidase [Candidatus Kerfeldbacteria bacterium]
MNADHRRYQAIRWTVASFGLGLVVTALFLAWRQWLSVAPYLQPQLVNCGCGTVAMGLTSSSVIVSFLALVAATTVAGRWAWFFGRHLFGQQRWQRRLAATGRQVHHQPTGLTITVTPDRQPKAMTIGLWRPMIVITAGLVRRLTKSELTAVIRHEQAHCRARDPLWSAALDSLGTAWFWLPWLRTWVGAAFRLRELAADAVVTAGNQQHRALGGAFLKLAIVETGPLPTFSPNHDRIERLLDRRWQPKLFLWRWPAVLSALAVIGFVVLFARWSAATAQSFPSAPRSLCQETIRMCHGLIRSADTPSMVCLEREGWLCFRPSSSVRPGNNAIFSPR